MQKSEEEQLLQDASTLLMFANVAAKQQQRPPPVPTTPQQPQPVLVQSVPPISHFQTAQSEPRLPEVKQENLPPIKTYYFPQPSHLPREQPTTSHPVQQASVHPTHQAPQLPHTSLSQSPPVSGSFMSPVGSVGSMGSSSSLGVPHSIVPGINSGAPQNPSAPIVINSSAPPTSGSPNPPPNIPSTVPSMSSTFIHKRTGSGQFRHSPGPANAALAGGVTEGGKRNNNNAMVAAAALAAAADMPLPLLKKEEVQVNPQSGPTTTTPSHKVPPPTASASNETEDEDNTDDEPEKSDPTPVVIESRITPTESLGESLIEEPKEVPKSKSRSKSPGTIKSGTPEPETKLQQKSKSQSPPRQEQEVNEKEEKEETPSVVVKKLSPSPSLNENPPSTSTLSSVAVPPLASYQVDPDSGLIGCICQIDDDDGFTVQCDICYRWQHCLCMNFKTNEEIPDEYKCYYCDEDKWGKFDPLQCKKNTLERLDSDKVTGEVESSPPIPKKELKRKHSGTGTSGSSIGAGDGVKKRKSSDSKGKRKDDEGSIVTASSSSNKSNSAVSNDHHHAKNDLPPLPNKDNDLLDGGISAEIYQGTYYKLYDNDYKTQAVKSYFEDLGKKFKDFPPTVQYMTKSEYKNLRLSKIILPKWDSLNAKKRKTNTGDTTVEVKSYSDNQKQKFNGISKLGLFIGSSEVNKVIPSETPVIEYLGEIGLYSQYKEDTTNQYNIWGTVKPRVVRSEIPLVEESVKLVSDARFVGNEARFIRKACPSAANCRIQPIFIKELQAFKFFIITTKDIHLSSEFPEEELRLEWQWDSKHPINKMYDHVDEETHEQVEGIKFDQFSESEKSILISSVDNVLNFVECACTTANSNLLPGYQANCALFKIKKATAYLLRSTRKALSVSSLNLSKSRDVLIMNKKPKKYISWQERSEERDRLIASDLLFAGGKGLDGDQNKEEIEAMEIDKDDIADEVEPTSENEKPIISRPIPYRDTLIAKSRALNDITVKIDTEKCDNRSLFVPLVPELVIKIQGAVSEKIEVPKVAAIAFEPKKEPEPEPEKVAVVAETVPEVEIKPQVVKKLSFADYKKKMK
ncbi:hypothetical protein CAAN1_07S07096 [[Candida] anglica]|uniref:SET domain-containing protein 3 n=1 Tax=[Candida] anglica TaxID=148631 RepID=A0ABP0EC65_9ASCO